MRSWLYPLCFIIVPSSGCVTHYTNPEARPVPANEIRILNPAHSIAVRNVSTKTGQTQLCKRYGDTFVGDLHVYTEAAVGMTKDVLRNQNVVIDDTVASNLDLEIVEATCEFGNMFTPFYARVTLRVKAGSALSREYRGVGEYRWQDRITPAMENAMSDCVKQMLKDGEVLKFLEN